MIRYEYVGRRGRREMTDWPLDVRQQRALNRQLDLLGAVDRSQAVGSVVHKVQGPGLYKIKVRGNVQLRPRLCFGPLEGEDEVVTLLQRVEKKGNKETPSAAAAAEQALNKIDEITENPTLRRALI